ncbi:MAG: hypothetical protein FH751_01375 [Firmicutes bacterium]|nr:hypothetical protein [Bacillota bacterium]
MNTIRKAFKKEVEELLPVLHETYRIIGIYQKDKKSISKRDIKNQLNIIGDRLNFFKKFIQENKQPYFDAILNDSLSISDRIISLDVAVGFMHIEFSIQRAYMHRESKELKKVLELSRINPDDKISEIHDDNILVKGVVASKGIVTGKAKLIRKKSDYKRLPKGSIIVTEMTRPEIVTYLDKVKAIVTNKGGSLCHAAIISRELNIPCIVGTKNATKIIKDKELIEVDGDKGIVKKSYRY